MARGGLFSFSSVGYRPKVQEQMGSEFVSGQTYQEKILDLVSSDRVYIELIHSTKKLYAFNLNDKQRVIISVQDAEGGPMMVVEMILANHDYNKLKKGEFQDIRIETLSPISDKQLGVQAQTNLESFKQKSYVYDRGRLVALTKEQVDITQVWQSVGTPGIYEVSGGAGSGKTMLAEIAISDPSAKDKNILYVTKSYELVAQVKKELGEVLAGGRAEAARTDICAFRELPEVKRAIAKQIFGGRQVEVQKLLEWITQKQKGDSNKYNAKILEGITSETVAEIYTQSRGVDDTGKITPGGAIDEYISELKRIIDKNDFINWARNLPKHNFSLPSYCRARNSEEFQKLYEDLTKIREVEGEAATLGRKQGFAAGDEKDSNIILSIRHNYLKHLRESGIVDLKFISASKASSSGGMRYDLVIVDEAQDLSYMQLDLILGHSPTHHNTQYLILHDSRQNLESRFTTTSQDIDLLGKTKALKVYPTKLADTHRMPVKVERLANDILSLYGKLAIKADKEVYEIKTSSVISGHIGKYTPGSPEVDDIIKKASSIIANTAVIAFDEQGKAEAAALFPDLLVFTPSTIKGLEFDRVILYGFFDYIAQLGDAIKAFPKYDAQNKPSTGAARSYAIDTQTLSILKPILTELYVSVSRTKDSLLFVDRQLPEGTGHKYTLAKYLLEAIVGSSGEGEVGRATEPISESTLTELVVALNVLREWDQQKQMIKAILAKIAKIGKVEVAETEYAMQAVRNLLEANRSQWSGERPSEDFAKFKSIVSGLEQEVSKQGVGNESPPTTSAPSAVNSPYQEPLMPGSGPLEGKYDLIPPPSKASPHRSEATRAEPTDIFKKISDCANHRALLDLMQQKSFLGRLHEKDADGYNVMYQLVQRDLYICNPQRDPDTTPPIRTGGDKVMDKGHKTGGSNKGVVQSKEFYGSIFLNPQDLANKVFTVWLDPENLPGVIEAFTNQGSSRQSAQRLLQSRQNKAGSEKSFLLQLEDKLIPHGSNIYAALFKAIDDNKPENVGMLIKLGAKVNRPYYDDDTALIFACRNRRTEVVKTILESIKDHPKFVDIVNAQDRDGLTALQGVMWKGIPKLIEAFIGSIKDNPKFVDIVNAQGGGGLPALELVMSMGTPENIKAFIGSIKDHPGFVDIFNAQDKGGLTALLQYAKHTCRPKNLAAFVDSLKDHPKFVAILNAQDEDCKDLAKLFKLPLPLSQLLDQADELDSIVSKDAHALNIGRTNDEAGATTSEQLLLGTQDKTTTYDSTLLGEIA